LPVMICSQARSCQLLVLGLITALALIDLVTFAPVLHDVPPTVRGDCQGLAGGRTGHATAVLPAMASIARNHFEPTLLEGLLRAILDHRIPTPRIYRAPATLEHLCGPESIEYA
jgi:hypothetical protein